MHGRWATAVNSDSMALERAQSCSLIEPGAYTNKLQYSLICLTDVILQTRKPVDYTIQASFIGFEETFSRKTVLRLSCIPIETKVGSFETVR